jgi:hypothetical protein
MRCPIALAVMRHFQPPDKIEVALDRVYFYTSTIKGPRLLPPEACKFIRDFDSGRVVKPFTFILIDSPFVSTI